MKKDTIKYILFGLSAILLLTNCGGDSENDGHTLILKEEATL